MSEQKLIQELSKGRKEAIKQVYLDNRSSFLLFAKKFSNYDEDILDVYQDAIIVLQEQALKGKLNSLKCSVKTYLFGIGKYMLYDKTREKNKISELLIVKEDNYNFKRIVEEFNDDSLTEYQKSLKKAFDRLGKKCKEILTLFYYRGFSIDEITNALAYENKNVVKSQKSRCIKKLKDLVKE